MNFQHLNKSIYIYAEVMRALYHYISYICNCTYENKDISMLFYNDALRRAICLVSALITMLKPGADAVNRSASQSTEIYIKYTEIYIACSTHIHTYIFFVFKLEQGQHCVYVILCKHWPSPHSIYIYRDLQ